MKSRWSDDEAAALLERYGGRWGEDLALRTYASRLLGSEPDLVLHGGGNASLKATRTDLLGETVRVLFVKASGRDMADIEPEGHCALDLAALEKLRDLTEMDDDTMRDELRRRRLSASAPTPSIETLVHAFIPETFIDHTHADAVLALTHLEGGESIVKEALGEDVLVLPYAEPGLPLARAAATAYEAGPRRRGMVWMHHGVTTWGATARESYESMIELVTRAERYLAHRGAAPSAPIATEGKGSAPGSSMPDRAGHRGAPGSAAFSSGSPDPGTGSHAGHSGGLAQDRGAAAGEVRAAGAAASGGASGSAGAEAARTTTAERRLTLVAPILRGLLAGPSGSPDRPHRRVVLAPLTDRGVLDFLDAPGAKARALTPPLTTDHLVRTKALPLWIDAPAFDDEARLRAQLAGAIQDYEAAYVAYVGRHASRMPAGAVPHDPRPRVVLVPGIGAICAAPTLEDARIARDITAHTLSVKAQVARLGTYVGLPEERLFDMEFRPMQRDKLGTDERPVLQGEVAIVTGAAGAIGSTICRELLENGCLVAATDLPGPPLDRLAAELGRDFGAGVLATSLDVTDRDAVAAGFERVIRAWGGVDLLVVNAGLALAAPLRSLGAEEFRRLERVNVEGTLFLLAEAERHFTAQRTGGDVVFVSTKNVFAPGAGFGAYSATKAAAHQLCRIASLEMASLDVRVNMVAPDAVFGEQGRRSGLWTEVGPERMRARGLDEAGLEEYYRNRNLLKARITGRHVARAVLFFASRQAPITGVTLPVDGGLPEATPR